MRGRMISLASSQDENADIIHPSSVSENLIHLFSVHHQEFLTHLYIWLKMAVYSCIYL